MQNRRNNYKCILLTRRLETASGLSNIHFLWMGTCVQNSTFKCFIEQLRKGSTRKNSNTKAMSKFRSSDFRSYCKLWSFQILEFRIFGFPFRIPDYWISGFWILTFSDFRIPDFGFRIIYWILDCGFPDSGLLDFRIETIGFGFPIFGFPDSQP